MTTTLALTTETRVSDGGTIVPLDRSTIKPVADLFSRIFLDSDAAAHDVCSYLESVFFSDPWHRLDVSPPLVYRDDDGSVLGFMGAHPRRFMHQGHEVTAVVAGQFMVDASLRGRGVGLRLVEALTAGPQTITFGTSANPAAVPVWCRAGFWHSPLGGLQWHRQLDDRRYSLDQLSCRVKHLIKRVRGAPTANDNSLSCRPIADASELHGLRASRIEPKSLCSDFDLAHTDWTWRMMDDAPTHRQLRGCVVLDHGDDPVGWAVYYVAPDNTARLLEFVFCPQRCRTVLETFFRYAARTDIRMVIGFCNTPELTAAAVQLGSSVTEAFSGWVVHCKDPDIQNAILNGQVFWSELDGEAWLNFRRGGDGPMKP